MEITEQGLVKMETKLENSWGVSKELFAGFPDIYDFEIKDYVHFLDNVKSLENLLEGLEQLSPFADDALEIAKHLNFPDFVEFKLALAYEHREGYRESKMPERYDLLIIPLNFLHPLLFNILEQFNVSLGVATIQMIRLESIEKYGKGYYVENGILHKGK